MATATTTKLASLLEKTTLFTASQVDDLLARHQEGGVSITHTVVTEGYAREDQFLEALAQAMGIPFVRLKEGLIAPDVLEKLSPKAVFQ